MSEQKQPSEAARPLPDDACLVESASKGDPYHPCVCACMQGHVGRHYCRCGHHWLPTRVRVSSPEAMRCLTCGHGSPHIQQDGDECFCGCVDYQAEHPVPPQSGPSVPPGTSS